MGQGVVKASVAALAGCGLLLGAWPAQAASPSFRGTVGPEETIGVSPRPKKAGTYRFVVRDLSGEHNFHLRGPGLSVATGIGSTGTTRFTVKLKPGRTYTFVCDPHADEMRGTFRVPS